MGRQLMTGLLMGLVATVMLGGTAFAAKPEVIFKNDPLAMDPFVDTDECPGLSILNEISGTRSRTLYFDAEGNETRLVIHVRYRLLFTNLDNGVTLTTAGARHIELDFVNNTWTETGLYRNVTANGAGTVMHVSGRLVEDLDTGELLQLSGPHEGVLEQYCAALLG